MTPSILKPLALRRNGLLLAAKVVTPKPASMFPVWNLNEVVAGGANTPGVPGAKPYRRVMFCGQVAQRNNFPSHLDRRRCELAGSTQPKPR